MRCRDRSIAAASRSRRDRRRRDRRLARRSPCRATRRGPRRGRAVERQGQLRRSRTAGHAVVRRARCAALDLRAIHGALIASQLQRPDRGARDATASLHARHDARGQRPQRAAARRIRRPTRSASPRRDVQLGGSRIDASGRVDLDRDRPFDLAGDAARTSIRTTSATSRRPTSTPRSRSRGTIGAAPPAAPAAVPRGSRRPHRSEPRRRVGRCPARSSARSTGRSVGSPRRASRRSRSGRSPARDVALTIGANRVTADGDFGRPQDRLRWTVDAPRLADLDVGVAGALTGNGFVGGTLDEPAIDFTIAGDDLRYARRRPPPSRRRRRRDARVPRRREGDRHVSLKSLRG